MAKVEIDIDVNEFRKQFNYLLDQTSYELSEEQEGLLNLFGGIRDALEAQGISVLLDQDTESVLGKSAIEQIADPTHRDQELQKLWNELEDVPFDFTEEHLDGILAENWAGFEAGTDKYEIWHWFDDQYSESIYHLMYPKDSCFEFTDCWGDKVETYFEVTSYAINGNLAILMMNEDPTLGCLEPYGDLTRNIADLPPYCAAVDTNNLSSNIVDALEEKGIAHRVGEIPSGFCTYPIMEFDPQALQRLHLSGAKKYAQLVADEMTAEKKKTLSLADRAAGAKEVSYGIEQDVSDRNIGEMKR